MSFQYLRLKTHETLFLIILSLVLILTRGSHITTFYSLPDASLALFMVGGIYLKNIRFFLRKKSDIDIKFKPFLECISENKTLINWNHLIQEVTPFLTSFKTWGNNKKILFVSPFSKSIEDGIKERIIRDDIDYLKEDNTEFIFTHK